MVEALQSNAEPPRTAHEPAVCTGDTYSVSLDDGPDVAPPIVEALRGQHVLDVAAGFARTLVLAGSGCALRVPADACTEAVAMEELGGLDGQLAQVAFGSKHLAALTHAGQVYTLGGGGEGQLGHGTTGNDSGEPQLVSGLSERAVAQVACGKGHALALTAEGDVYSWGRGDEGQLGTGRTAPSFVPRYLSSLQGTPIACISSGAAHCAALSVYGRVYTWGEALCGQLGHGKPLHSKKTPCEVAALPDAVSIACGEFHTVALSAEGEVYAWGLARRGPPLSKSSTPLPQLVEGVRRSAPADAHLSRDPRPPLARCAAPRRAAPRRRSPLAPTLWTAPPPTRPYSRPLVGIPTRSPASRLLRRLALLTRSRSRVVLLLLRTRRARQRGGVRWRGHPPTSGLGLGRLLAC